VAIVRVGQHAAGGVHGRRVVVEDPAEDVEVVDQHVAEDAARALQVLDWRRARVAARDDQHLGRADLAAHRAGPWRR
jgi:hypothetical protein